MRQGQPMAPGGGAGMGFGGGGGDPQREAAGDVLSRLPEMLNRASEVTVTIALAPPPKERVADEGVEEYAGPVPGDEEEGGY